MDANKLLKTLASGRNNILIPHLDRYLGQGEFPEKWEIEIRNYKESDLYFHPSGDCLASLDDLYIARVMPKDVIVAARPEISPALRRTFDIGHMVHGYLQAILVEMGFIESGGVEKEKIQTIISAYGTCIAKGTGDLVGVDIPGHGKWLVDIKTMGKYSFDSPDEYLMRKYTAQVNVYGDWFEYDKLMILAFCKDSPHDMKEFIIRRDETLISNIYKRWCFVQDSLEKSTPPWERKEYTELSNLF